MIPSSTHPAVDCSNHRQGDIIAGKSLTIVGSQTGPLHGGQRAIKERWTSPNW